MKTTVVITTNNRADDLERCIDSIPNQENCEIEIIVVDDASKDRTCSTGREKY
jgi:glycosyltransferase involved in cell wall biosynthesis